MMVVRPQSTAEPAVLPMLTPVAVAVRQTLFEQQFQALEEKVASLQPVEPRSPLTRLSDHFGSLPDPREPGLVEHKLLDIIIIAICAVICGADSWVEIEEFGKARYQWLNGFLELPNGIPSHDTFGRVFARVSAVAFQRCFASWIQTVFTVTQGQVIAIDGKTLRGPMIAVRVRRRSIWSVPGRMPIGWSWDKSKLTRSPMKSRRFLSC